MNTITIISIVIMIIGILGMIHPLFPGTIIVFLGPLLYVAFNGFSKVSISIFAVITVLTVMSFFIDNIASVLGTKKFGASKEALIGAIIGGFIGLVVFSIPGFLIGQFLGVVVTEALYGKEFKKSLKAGAGVFIGYVAGYLMKLFIGGIILLLFVIRVV